MSKTRKQEISDFIKICAGGTPDELKNIINNQDVYVSLKMKKDGFIAAGKNGNLEMVKYFLDVFEFEYYVKQIHVGTFCNQPKVIELITRYREKPTPSQIHDAITKFNDIDFVKYCIQKKYMTETFLLYAIKNVEKRRNKAEHLKSVEILKLILIEGGIDLNDKAGSKPFNYSFIRRCNTVETLQLLIDHGLDVNKLYKTERYLDDDEEEILVDDTYLNHLVRYLDAEENMNDFERKWNNDKIELIKCLLKNGADINHRPHEKIGTAFENCENSEVRELLRTQHKKEIVYQMYRLVETPEGEIRRVFPFPTAGGHIKLFVDISEYIYGEKNK